MLFMVVVQCHGRTFLRTHTAQTHRSYSRLATCLPSARGVSQSNSGCPCLADSAYTLCRADTLHSYFQFGIQARILKPAPPRLAFMSLFLYRRCGKGGVRLGAMMRQRPRDHDHDDERARSYEDAELHA